MTIRPHDTRSTGLIRRGPWAPPTIRRITAAAAQNGPNPIGPEGQFANAS